MNAVIYLDVPDWQIGQNVTVYFPDTMVKHCKCELLKEHEAVEPKYNARTNWYECGACHYSMTSGMHCRSVLIPAFKVGFCAYCGQAVKWE